VREGFTALRLAYRAVELLVDYHKDAESDQAYAALNDGARSLRHAAAATGWSNATAIALILGPLESELGPMYGETTARRLILAFRSCFEPSKSL
jgi:hypothetical protein